MLSGVSSGFLAFQSHIEICGTTINGFSEFSKRTKGATESCEQKLWLG